MIDSRTRYLWVVLTVALCCAIMAFGMYGVVSGDEKCGFVECECVLCVPSSCECDDVIPGCDCVADGCAECECDICNYECLCTDGACDNCSCDECIEAECGCLDEVCDYCDCTQCIDDGAYACECGNCTDLECACVDGECIGEGALIVPPNAPNTEEGGTALWSTLSIVVGASATLFLMVVFLVRLARVSTIKKV